jgi:hypothetical protein
VFFAVHGPMLDHSEDPCSLPTSGGLAPIYSVRRLKLRVSYTRSTWGASRWCTGPEGRVGSGTYAIARSGPNLPSEESPATHGPGSLLIVSHHTGARRVPRDRVLVWGLAHLEELRSQLYAETHPA